MLVEAGQLSRIIPSPSTGVTFIKRKAGLAGAILSREKLKLSTVEKPTASVAFTIEERLPSTRGELTDVHWADQVPFWAEPFRVALTKPAPMGLQSKKTLVTPLPPISVMLANKTAVWPSLISVWLDGYMTVVEVIFGVELSVKKMNGVTCPVLPAVSRQETVQLWVAWSVRVELKEFISPFSIALSIVMLVASTISVQLAMLLIWSTGKYWNERLPAGTKLSLAGRRRRMAGGIVSITS